MSSLNIENTPYNDIPVMYCKKCLSLNIRHVRSIDGSEYCDECGNTDLAEAHITEWEKLYEAKYGHKLLDEY